MVQKKDLEIMAEADFQGAGSNALPDLLEVDISGGTPAERLESLLAQGVNPYCFRVGQTPVRLTFHNDESPLTERLKSYFLTLKGRGV